MQYTIEIVEDATTLRTNTLRCLKRLTQRDIKVHDGCGMKYLLMRIQGCPKDFSCRKVFIARNTSGKIIAWGLLTRKYNRYYKSHEDFEFNVYVAGKYRKMGIGRELFNEANYALKGKRGKLEFHSWSDQSTKFYSKIVHTTNAQTRRRFDCYSVAAATYY